MVKKQEQGGMHDVPDSELERFARGQVTFTDWNRLYRVIRENPRAQQRVHELVQDIHDDTERGRVLEIHEALRDHFERLAQLFATTFGTTGR